MTKREEKLAVEAKHDEALGLLRRQSTPPTHYQLDCFCGAVGAAAIGFYGLAHNGSTFSGVGASGNPGAVHCPDCGKREVRKGWE